MKIRRWSLTLSFLSAAVFVIALLFLALLGGQRVALLYRGVAGFGIAQGLALWGGGLAALGTVIAAAIITVWSALRPGNWLRKVVSVLPVLLLLFAVAGFAAMLFGIGTISTLATLPLVGPLTFADAWLLLGALLAGLALVLSAATVTPGPRVRRAATTTLGLSALAATVAGLAIVAMLVIAATNQPGLPAFGRAEAAAPRLGGQAAQAGTEFRPGGEGGFGGEGRFGGRVSLAAARQQFTETGGVAVVGALGLVFSSLATLSLGRKGNPLAATDLSSTTASIADGAQASGAGTGREVGRTLLAGVAVFVVIGGLLQLVPVNRTNPPVQTTVQWDSPQTQQLWERACADCHSNQTQWPWYATLAPGSWLTAAHVNAGRARFNVSEMSSFARGAGELADQIRSGAMPLADYTLIHPAARLTDAEKQALIQGLEKSLGRQGR